VRSRRLPPPLPAERVYRRAHGSGAVETPAPLVWAFDGPLEGCLADIEDTLRRALLMIGDVSRVALLIELSLPALQQRVAAGDRVQPGWANFHQRLAAYGLPLPPRVRPHARPGPLARLVIAYRN
jgi:hypothetical protein